ncbi:uncharacterized protein LOC120662829 [Panicum virgatum]|uniref:Uncharacterized protein n=1 Tax=Panicum virgatum TaxID=38727 RepID=A0A8T0W0N6_PANVG|nr:uncharacterized protein LOC120662829 [Panicum virgatum]KAG2637059.1 hypothetical protein PVAP13_2NG491600 [Panicum virgatum]
MARESIYGASWEEAFHWQRPDELEVRDVAVDPFSLRQFSRLNIDRPLPIPSVSVDDRSAHVSPARFDTGASVPATAAAASPRASIAGGIKALATPTGLGVDDARPAAHSPPSAALPRSKLSDSWETELADAGFDVALPSSSERKASEPQRWGSDVPLIAAADAEEYSFGGAKAGRGKQQAKHAGKGPFTCCMHVPGLARRIKPPTSTAAAAVAMAARPYSSSAFGNKTAAAVEAGYPSTCSASARPSNMSLAVSLERFDCLSTSSSSRGLGLDDGEAASSSSCFELPLELILGCDDGEESDLPVCAAFLFDSDGVRKSVLKRRLEAGAGMEPRRPSLGKVSTDSPGTGRISTHHVRVSLKSRSPAASTSP